MKKCMWKGCIVNSLSLGVEYFYCPEHAQEWTKLVNLTNASNEKIISDSKGRVRIEIPFLEEDQAN